eukprot:513316-Amphidinium_carterae.2
MTTSSCTTGQTTRHSLAPEASCGQASYALCQIAMSTAQQQSAYPIKDCKGAKTHAMLVQFLPSIMSTI